MQGQYLQENPRQGADLKIREDAGGSSGGRAGGQEGGSLGINT